MLQTIQQFVNESNQSNSNLDKLQVLTKYSQDVVVRRALLYTYDTLRQYGVTSKNCKKQADLTNDTYYDLFELLDDLATRKITGHEAVASVNGFVAKNKEYQDLIWNILDRNMKTRSTTSMINKVIPGLIPTFDVALAASYNEKTASNLYWEDRWYISRKLDGVRCLTLIDGNGNITCYSRAGKEFLTLDRVKQALSQLQLTNVVLDGEICVVDENGDESFAEVAKQIKRKDYTIENAYYQVFDKLTTKEFLNKVSDRAFSDRYAELVVTLPKTQFYGVLPQELGTQEIFETRQAEAIENGWEGLMLRKDTTYKGKRSNDILKVKQFFDEEYTVLSTHNEVHRVVENGEEREEEMLGYVTIEHKGNIVSVGSGFSKAQRRRYYTNPHEIIGKQITVQYFEETTDQYGNHSLRFPTVKTVYETKRDF